MTFLMEPRVANREDLIDQIAVKLDRHRQGKREPRAHARGVGLHRLPEIGAELGELLNEGDGPIDIGAIDATDETQVV